jgi:hypothetical protein
MTGPVVGVVLDAATITAFVAVMMIAVGLVAGGLPPRAGT